MRKGIQFWPAARHFPEQNFIGNLETAAVTQDMRKKIEMFIEICIRNKIWEKENSRLSYTKFIILRISCWFTIFFALTNTAIYSLVWVVVW